MTPIRKYWLSKTPALYLGTKGGRDLEGGGGVWVGETGYSKTSTTLFQAIFGQPTYPLVAHCFPFGYNIAFSFLLLTPLDNPMNSLPPVVAPAPPLTPSEGDVTPRVKKLTSLALLPTFH